MSIPFEATASYFNGTRTAVVRLTAADEVEVLSASSPSDWTTQTGLAATVKLTPVSKVTLKATGDVVSTAELDSIATQFALAQVGLVVRGFDINTGALEFEADSQNTDLANSNDNVQYRGLRVVLKDLRLGPDQGRWFTPGTSATVYAGGTTYAANALVTYTDGLIYLSLQAGNIGHDPSAAGSAYWIRADVPGAGGYSAGDRVTYVRSATTYTFASLKDSNVTVPLPPDYGAGTAYVVGDMVFSGGTTYICILAGTGHTPGSSPTYWQVKYSEWWTLKTYVANLNYGTSKVSYVFTYTLVNGWNEEGPPASPVSIEADYGQTISLHGFINHSDDAYNSYSKGVGVGYKLRYYGFVSDSQGSGEYRLIKETDELAISPATQAFGHWIINKPADWEDALASTDYDLPPDYPLAIAPGANGMLGILTEGFFAVCEPYRGHTYPVKYRIALPYKGIGLLGVPGGWLVTTVRHPYFIAGPIPEQLSKAQLPIEQAGISQAAMCSMGEAGTIYASNDGLVLVQGLGATIASGVLFTRKEWRARYAPLLSLMRLAYHDGRLVCLFPGTDESQASNYQGFIIRFDEGTPVYTRMSITGSGMAIDALNDQLLIGKVSSGVWGFCAFETGNPLPLTWQSKEFIVPRPVNFGCGMIEYTGGPMALDVHANGATTATITVPYSATRTEYKFRLPPGYKAQRWSVYVTEGVYLAWSSLTTYASGTGVSSGGLNYVAIATSLNVTPGTDDTKWTLIGGETVHRILLATTMAELNER